MIALGGPKLKRHAPGKRERLRAVSMIALGGPKLKPLIGFVERTVTGFQ